MKVKELLSDESKWTQVELCLDSDGKPCLTREAVRFCLMGAVYRCYADKDRWPIERKIERLVVNYVVWNDAPERTFAEVKALVEELDI